MKPRVHDPQRLDVAAFAAADAELAGRWQLSELPRLIDVVPPDAPSDDLVVTWSARGELRRVTAAEPQIWLHLTASTTLWMQCQRCLQPVEVPLQIDQSLRFVRDEDTAARLDADSEHDVLALERALDLRSSVEDELVLALPLVPRHEMCTAAPHLSTDEEEDVAPKPNPFAGLAALKRGRPS